MWLYRGGLWWIQARTHTNIFVVDLKNIEFDYGFVPSDWMFMLTWTILSEMVKLAWLPNWAVYDNPRRWAGCGCCGWSQVNDDKHDTNNISAWSCCLSTMMMISRRVREAFYLLKFSWEKHANLRREWTSIIMPLKFTGWGHGREWIFVPFKDMLKEMKIYCAVPCVIQWNRGLHEMDRL